MAAQSGGNAGPRTPRGNVEEDIIPRNLHFGTLGNATRYWYDNDLNKTAMIDALSIFLPEGERFFIRSLKHYASRLDDKELAAEINGYAVQEAFHTREHEEYNKALEGLGYNVAEMEKPVRRVLSTVKDPLLRLAVTCAIEHLTATLSAATLRHPELFDGAVPRYRQLWMWHALEEMEHKAVALDVFNTATQKMPGWKRYFLRITAMNSTILPFIWIFLRNVRLYARTDGAKTGFRFWMGFAYTLFVFPGYWRHSAGTYFRYYIPGYNPRNAEDKALVAKGRAWLDDEMPSGIAPSGAAG